MVSLLVPFYNEEKNLERLLDRLIGVSWKSARPSDEGHKCQFVFVDDCSTDQSQAKLKGWIGAHQDVLRGRGIEVVVDRLSKNSGKGAALHRAIELAEGEVCIVQDADFEYDPQEIPQLVQPIFDGEADVVYGSRFKKNAFQVHRTFHYFVNAVLTLLSNVLSGIYISDMETCYKAIRTEILKGLNLRSPRFGFEVEVTAHIARLRVRMRELPISYYPRNQLQGKKITWKDGLAALWHLVYFNLLMQDAQRFNSKMPSKYLRLV